MNRCSKLLSRKGSICILSGIAMLIAALILIICNVSEGIQAGKASQEVMVVLEEKIIPQTTISEQTLDSDANEKELTTVIDGNDYIGVLEIPSLELVLPVISELDDVKLKTAPCRYSGSYYTDDMVISGHNYAQHFKNIKNMKVGDEIVFTALDGITYRYIVSATEILAADEVERMVTGEWDLTLFTCTNDREHRFAVRCERKTE